MSVYVSDGWLTTEGELTVLVQEPGNIAPIANADFYVARVGEPLVVAPLANDTDPNGDVLMLTKVSTAPPSTTLVPDLELGVVTFTGSQVGSYEFTYTVSDGPQAVVGVVRVDVVSGDEPTTRTPPAASWSSSPSRLTPTRVSRWLSSIVTSCA